MPRSPTAALLDDDDWLRARRAEGWTPVVRAAVTAAGLPPKLGGPKFPELYDLEWMRTQLAEHTITEIARRLGCSTRSAKDAARRAGIPGRQRQPRPRLLNDRIWLEQQLRRRRTYDDIAATLGRSTKAVGRAVRHHGLSDVARQRRQFPELHDPDWLRRALVTRTVTDIARALGCSVEAVRAARRRSATASPAT
jgi:DNA-binding CsgD family transcriptional regulator